MWWPFTSEKTYKESEVMVGMTDFHTHILPGVDDGVQEMDDAIQILKQFQHLGIKDVWLTPHIMEDMPNKTDDLRQRFEELKEKYAEECGKHHTEQIGLHLSSENMLDNLFAERLKAKDLLPHGDKGDMLLVETSYVQAPNNFYDLIKNIQDAGYYPVLAHPERYFYMHTPDYRKLHNEMGVKFQMNIPALSGVYGPEPKRRAKKLLEAGMYDYIGTDIHGLRKFFGAITEYKISNKHIKIIKEIIELNH